MASKNNTYHHITSFLSTYFLHDKKEYSRKRGKIIGKNVNGWIICLNVLLCYKLVTSLVFSYSSLNIISLTILENRYKHSIH